MSYWGGVGSDVAKALAVDKFSEAVYVVGETNSNFSSNYTHENVKFMGEIDWFISAFEPRFGIFYGPF